MSYSFTHDTLGEAMILRANDGVTIEGIFETLGANTIYSECGRLLSEGYDIRLDGNPRTFHHKIIIIDGAIVILGSFNFTNNADESNDENLLIVYDSKIAQLYEQEYQLMKSQAFSPTGDSYSK